MYINSIRVGRFSSQVKKEGRRGEASKNCPSKILFLLQLIAFLVNNKKTTVNEKRSFILLIVKFLNGILLKKRGGNLPPSRKIPHKVFMKE